MPVRVRVRVRFRQCALCVWPIVIDRANMRARNATLCPEAHRCVRLIWNPSHHATMRPHDYPCRYLLTARRRTRARRFSHIIAQPQPRDTHNMRENQLQHGHGARLLGCSDTYASRHTSTRCTRELRRPRIIIFQSMNIVYVPPVYISLGRVCYLVDFNNYISLHMQHVRLYVPNYV